jgi:IclR family acetate operon transcriptional repressor
MAPSTSIHKAIELLFFLNAQPGPCGVSAIASGLGLPKASAHRLLKALAHRHLVRQDERGHYGLGVGLVALGFGASRSEPLVRAARPVLASVAASVGETFFLVAERASELVVLDKAEGAGFLRISPQVGAHVPVHATAVGRLYLAYAPERVFIDEAHLAAFTEHTPKTPSNLRHAVALTKKLGVATSEEEWIVGLSTAAAPIFLAGRLIGAVVVACVTPRYRELGRDSLVRAVRRASERISKELEGT